MEKNSATQIEQYVIDRVREIRENKGVSQAQLAYMIDVSPAFIGSVENPKERAKYNLNHINEIARALECSLHDIIPEKSL